MEFIKTFGYIAAGAILTLGVSNTDSVKYGLSYLMSHQAKQETRLAGTTPVTERKPTENQRPSKNQKAEIRQHSYQLQKDQVSQKDEAKTIAEAPKPKIKIGEIYRGQIKSYAVAISADGRYLIRDDPDTNIYLFDMRTRSLIDKFVTNMYHKYRNKDLGFSKDGQLVISSGYDGLVRLWDFKTKEEIRRFKGMTAALSHDKQHVLVGGSYGEVHLMDAATGVEIRNFGGHNDWVVRSVAFSSDDRLALSGADDRFAYLWDVQTSRPLHRFRHWDSVTGVAFTRDNRYGITASKDKTSRVWNLETGEEVHRLHHESDMLSLAISPDDCYAVSAGYSNIHLWDIITGKEVIKFSLPLAEYAYSIAFSPDGVHALSGGTDGTRLWRLPLSQETETRSSGKVCRKRINVR